MSDIDELQKAALGAQQALQASNRAIEAVSKVAPSPFIDAVRTIHENSAVRRLLEDIERNRDLIRLAEGPLAELRRSGVFDPASPLHGYLQRTQEIMSGFESRFRLPDIAAAASLVDQLQASPLAEVMVRYSDQASSLQQAIEAMRTPWLDTQESLRSVAAFAELQGIGHLVDRLPTFGDQVADALRVNLGDWRDPIAWPEAILSDLEARSRFYLGLGFDPALTNFPAAAFREGVEIAGLRRELPPLVEAYGPPSPPPEDVEEEEALQRTNAAHDWLLRLETHVRQFIDTRMTDAFGPDWPKRRLPRELHDKWQEKKRKAEKAGRRVHPLVAYADFTDYEKVICKRDNWREVFAPWFGRPESVRETLQRLYPIRLDTMHSRPITQDDELLLYVEARRLIRVILE